MHARDMGGGVENRNILLHVLRPVAHVTACTTLQAVMHIGALRMNMNMNTFFSGRLSTIHSLTLDSSATTPMKPATCRHNGH